MRIGEEELFDPIVTFPAFKKYPGGMHFASDEEVTATADKFLSGVGEIAVRRGDKETRGATPKVQRRGRLLR